MQLCEKSKAQADFSVLWSAMHVPVFTLTGEHEAEEVAGSSQHNSVGWEVFPLNHQGHIAEGALGTTSRIMEYLDGEWP